jgi:hypothetical protein
MVVKTILYILLIIWPILIIYILSKKKYKSRLEKMGLIFSGLAWIYFLLVNFLF